MLGIAPVSTLPISTVEAAISAISLDQATAPIVVTMPLDVIVVRPA